MTANSDCGSHGPLDSCLADASGWYQLAGAVLPGRVCFFTRIASRRRGLDTDEFFFLLAIATAVVQIILVEHMYPVVVPRVANSDRIKVLRGRFCPTRQSLSGRSR